MSKRTLTLCALAGALSLSTGVALPADPTPDDRKIKAQEQVYGSQVMTQQERIEYLAEVRAAKTADARELVRKEHHERMRARASARGISLSDEPLGKDNGMGGGTGVGPADGGMGLGGGRGN